MTENKRSRGLVVAVVVLVLLVGVSLVALLLNRGGDGSQAAPSAAPTGAQPTSASSAPAEVLPPLTAAPAGVTWKLFQGVALPTSRTDGPTRVTGPVHAGYSQTPTGALLAAAQIVARSIVDPGLSDLRQIGQQQLVAGPGQTAYLTLVNSFTDNQPPAAGYAQYVGFRYITYAPDVAVVSLATQSRSGVFQAGTHTVRWVDGDWKLELPQSGLQQPQVVQNISGYVPWSGVS